MAVPGYSSPPRVELGDYDPPHQWWPGYVIVAVLLLAGAIGGAVLRGSLGDFMVAGVEVVPFAILAFLAYLGVRQTWAQVLAFIWLLMVLLGLSGIALLLALAPLLQRTGVLGATASGTTPRTLLPPGGAAQLGAVAFWSLIGLVVAAMLLLPAVRQRVSRVLPIDRRSVVHAIALSVVGGATIISLGQLIAAGSKPPALEMVGLVPEQSASQQLLGIVFPFVWTVPGALIAVGFPIMRTFRAALTRLGLVRPTGRQVLSAIGIAVLLVIGAQLLDVAIGRVWGAMGWPRTDSAAFDKLLGAAISPLGAVLIGVTAGIGEEMVVRGALQPRLGILLSNLFFTSLHAYQYGFDALLSVFVVGMVLGVVRARSNTTTSSIVHGTYDFILVLISALALFK
jgi:membrane protease YdiL (CAAX protease family)